MGTPKKIRAKSIGHYILGKTIGEGTFGKVKLGTHILTGEKVAVKVLEKERIVDVADVERVAREIHILKLIQHPHVIQLYEIIETPRQLYLITEYCSGGELFDHIVASGRVREREACRFFHQIIAGVEQIHRQNVVHRDLKPENLLLDDQRNIKIVDFGLSNTFQDGQLLKTACGSPCYAAPEMIAGQRYVPARCDVWSCGVILFALVCGYLPFEDQNTSTLYRKILNADYQAPKFISDGVRDLIGRMLNTDPEQRFTISRVRAHAWYNQIAEASHRWDGVTGERVLEEDILEQLDRFGFPRDYAARCLQMNKHNHVTTTYYLLVEKKRRVSDKMQDLSGSRTGGQIAQELDMVNEQFNNFSPLGSGDITDPAGAKQGFEATAAAMLNTAADADRAGGASPAPPISGRPPRTPDNNGNGGGAPYGQWAQALGLPLPQGGNGGNGGNGASANAVAASGPPSARTMPGEQTAAGVAPGPRSETPCRGDTRGGDAHVRRGAASAEPPSGAHLYQQPYGGPPQSPRGPMRPGEYATPRGAAGSPVAAQPNSSVQRKRVPLQQATGFATPRGPVLTPPPNVGSATAASRSGASNNGVLGSPSGPRSVTPAKRGSAGVSGGQPGTPTGAFGAGGDPMSARSSGVPGSRPGTSQGIAAPTRPSGSATARSHNEARRRHYAHSIAADSGAGGSAPVRPMRPASPGNGRSSAAAGAITPDLQGGGSVGSRASGGPTSAWTARPGVAIATRASSASPEVVQSNSNEIGGIVSGALSARESRQSQGGEEVMKTCRGAFNVSCTSSKAPKQIMQEIHRALTLHRITYKQASAFLVKCQRHGLRFEMEISHLDHLESIYVVRFRRVAGELVGYKELCSKVLAEMKM